MSGNFFLRIRGENVRPDTVALPDLIDILTYLNTALAAHPKGLKLDPFLQISLVGIKNKSLGVAVATDPRTQRRAKKIATAIRDDNPNLIPVIAQRSLQKIWRKGYYRGWDIELHIKGGGVAYLLRDKPIFDRPEFRENTTVLAWIIRAGGDTSQTANIRLPNGQRLTAKLASRDIALQLGNVLYQWVELEGDAVWDPRDWRLLRFKVDSLGPYRSGSSDPLGALKELSQASNGFWDNVDPDEYVKEVRGNS